MPPQKSGASGTQALFRGGSSGTADDGTRSFGFVVDGRRTSLLGEDLGSRSSRREQVVRRTASHVLSGNPPTRKGSGPMRYGGVQLGRSHSTGDFEASKGRGVGGPSGSEATERAGRARSCQVKPCGRSPPEEGGVMVAADDRRQRDRKRLEGRVTKHRKQSAARMKGARRRRGRRRPGFLQGAARPVWCGTARPGRLFTDHPEIRDAP